MESGGGQEGGAKKKIPKSDPCHKQEGQHHLLEPSGNDGGQGGGAYKQKIPKSDPLCVGHCQDTVQDKKPTAQVELLIDKPRDHRRKKQHHRIALGGTSARDHDHRGQEGGAKNKIVPKTFVRCDEQSCQFSMELEDENSAKRVLQNHKFVAHKRLEENQQRRLYGRKGGRKGGAEHKIIPDINHLSGEGQILLQEKLVQQSLKSDIS
jgi:hypothetical protein